MEITQSIGHGPNLRYRHQLSGRALLAIAAVAMLTLTILLAAAPLEAQDQSAEPLWSADMLVVQYTDVSIGAASSDLFSNVGGTADLQIKWLWSYTTDRDLRLAFEEVISDTEDLTLQAGDLALAFPEGSSGQSSFKWTGVDVDWEDGQTISVSIVPTPATEAPQPSSPATGQPTISGTAKVNQTLTADTSGISDEDGLNVVSYSYQWIANGADISGATGSTHTPSVSDVGKTIKVRVSFTDDANNQESLTSDATAPVAATVPTQPLGLTVTKGDRIRELDASWQAPSSNGGSDVTGYKVQWKETTDSWDTTDDVSEGTATGTTYTITGLTGGEEYAVRVIATNDVGDGPASAEEKESPEGGTSQQNVEPENNAPTGLPTISGTAQAGETLTAHVSAIADADGLTSASFGYQWMSNDGTTDTDIADATSSSYIIKPWDLGKYVKVRVNFTDNVGNQETLTSAATVAVEAIPNRPPKGVLHLNGIAEVGQELSVFGLGFWGRGIWDDNGLMYGSFNYQWIRNDGTTDFDIPGATSSDPNTGPLPYISTVGASYTLTDADEGKTIKVRLSFTDDGGNVETLTSTETTAVTARPSTSDLGEPTALTVEWSQGEEKGLDLSWTAPEGTVTSYQILRLEIPTRSRWWEPYPYGCTPLMEVHVSDTGGGATAYTDTDVAEGASYTYSVRALNSDGVGRKSASPRSLQYRPPHTPTSSYWPSGVPGTPYRVPTNLASRQIKNGIGLTWEAPEGEVTGYQILRRSPEQCDYGYRVYVENTNSTDTHWADRNVVAGTRYEYHVRAVNDVGAGRLDRSISTSLRPTTLVVGPEPNNPATGTPTITGTAQVGETLTADPSGIADADGMHWSRFSYQWRSSRDTEIEGATGPTYRIETSDANKLIKVRVEFMDDSGYEESLTSAATAAVSPNISATGAPAITGTAEVGGHSPLTRQVSSTWMASIMFPTATSGFTATGPPPGATIRSPSDWLPPMAA